MNLKLSDSVQQLATDHGLPGLAVSVRHHGQQVFAHGWGYFDPAGRLPVTADTRFGVASLTKLVTAIVILRLQEQGALTVDDRLSRFFPELRVAQRAPIRLKHLLSHASGLPGLPARFHALNLDDPTDRAGGIPRDPQSVKPANHELQADAPMIQTAAELVRLINQLDANGAFDVLAEPDAILNYSNESYCLLGGVIEQVGGLPFSLLADETVLQPLKMRNSRIGSARPESLNDLALPLIRVGAEYRQGAFWDAPLFYPAGGLISSASDVSRLISAVGRNANNVPGLLGDSSREQLIGPHMAVPSRPARTLENEFGYGFGVEYQRIDSQTTLIWHSGQRAGVSSFTGYIAEQALAVTVLSNVGEAPVTGIAHQLLGQILTRDDIAWPPTALPTSDQTIATDDFIACYASGEGNCVRVERAEDSLIMTGASITTPATLHFTTPDSGVVGHQTFRFLRRPPGDTPWALAIDLRVLVRSQP